MFLFDNEVRLLHTGDCRLSDRIRRQFPRGSVDVVYLDTTYADRKFTFPPQSEACEMIEKIAEENHDALLVCPAYAIGKENAIEAAARGVKGKAFVSERRAHTLELCGRLSSVYTTDREDPDVKIIVDSFGSGPRQRNETPHDALKRRFGSRKIVQLNCTGWTFKKNGVRPWRQDQTVIYGIPYSEHSSFVELEAFLASLRPKKMVPTVNAEDKGLTNLFAKHLDNSANPGKLDKWLLTTTTTTTTTTTKSGIDKWLFPEKTTKKKKKTTVVDGTVLAQIREVLGVDDRRGRQLLKHTENDVHGAIDAHFADDDLSSDSDSIDGKDLLLGAVFAVQGGDAEFQLFRGSKPSSTTKKKLQEENGAADKIRSRLTELGATVIDKRNAKSKKFIPTHVIVPEGTDPGSLRSVAIVKTESWLIQKFRSFQASNLASPSLQDRKIAEKSLHVTTKRKADVCSITKKKRKGRRRTATNEANIRAERALDEKMFLLHVRDETPPSLCRVPRRLVFIVLGSTGNVYTVTLTTEPSCDCPFSKSHPTDVCKHRFFLFSKVLKVVPREENGGFNDLAYQRYLRYDELEYLASKITALSALASTAARTAYRSSVGLRPDDDDDQGDDVPRVANRTCDVCFDDLLSEEGKKTDISWCRRGCGRQVHTSCLAMWMSHGGPGCPACRAPWESEESSSEKEPTTEEGGFLNLRSLQPGIPADRNTSSYAVDNLGRQWIHRHAERRQAADAGLHNNTTAATAVTSHSSEQPSVVAEIDSSFK